VSPAVLALAGLAAIVAGALEVQRADRRHRAGRLAASLIAVAAIAALALEPALPRRVSDSRAVLATEGVSPADARRIADSVGARDILSLGPELGDLAALRRTRPDLTEIVVAGWGLPAEELVRAGDLRIAFVPAPLPPGLRFVEWPSRITLGEKVRLHGEGAPGAALHVQVRGGFADSTRAGANGMFELSFTPKAVGLVTFELRSPGAVDTGSVDVRAPRRPSVLIVEGTPGFELAHFRRWHARRGGQVAAHITVGRGRVRTAAINGAPALRRDLSPEVLRAYDVVVMDAAAARALGRGEVQALRDAVRRDGLGLFLAGEPPRLTGLPVPGIMRRSSTRALRVRPAGSASWSPPVTAEAWRPVTGDAGTVMLEDDAGGAIAAWEAAGAGRIGSSAVRNPSRWMLEGDSTAYDRYWTTILAALGRPKPAWRSPEPLPAEIDRPLSLAWPGRLDTVLVSGGGTIDTLFPAPDPDSLTWSAAWWPRGPGEFRAAAPGDTLRLLAAAPGNWSAARAAERARATKLYAAVYGRAPAPTMAWAAAPVPPWLFMAAFTAAAGWLWWERRRTGIARAGAGTA
jgi:hypothetical protein